MRFAVAGGGVAGLAAALAVARAGHEAVVVERDAVQPEDSPEGAFDAPRKGIPHFQQPHTFLPRGRRELRQMAPDVLEDLLAVGAHEQDVAEKLRGPRQPGDEDLVYLWVRRPVIEWALRRAAAREPGVTLRAGGTVAGVTDDGLALEGGEVVPADVVVDALGRYRTPAGWPRAAAESSSCGAIYYCRYFEGELPTEGPWLLNPRGDLGYMGFNTFRGDNGTFAAILLVPEHDRELRVLRENAAWEAATARMRPLDEVLPHARPLTDVMPMGGLANVLRDAPGDPRVAAVGDAFCHTDPSQAYGLSFALAHARELGRAATEHADATDVVAAYHEAVHPEALERYELVQELDEARGRAWREGPLPVGRRDACYPLFSLVAAVATAPHDDLILRRTIGRIGLLDRTHVFDEDAELHDRIETHFARLSERPPPAVGPPRDELLSVLP